MFYIHAMPRAVVILGSKWRLKDISKLRCELT